MIAPAAWAGDARGAITFALSFRSSSGGSRAGP